MPAVANIVAKVVLYIFQVIIWVFVVNTFVKIVEKIRSYRLQRVAAKSA